MYDVALVVVAYHRWPIAYHDGYGDVDYPNGHEGSANGNFHPDGHVDHDANLDTGSNLDGNSYAAAHGHRDAGNL